jgi:hypothetical protein
MSSNIDEEISILNIEIEKLKKKNKEIVDKTNEEIKKNHEIIIKLKKKINEEKIIISDYLKKHEIFKENKKKEKEKKDLIKLQDEENKFKSIKIF